MSGSLRKVYFWVAVLLVAITLGWTLLRTGSPMHAQSHAAEYAIDSGIFTPEHRSALSAIREYIGWREAPVQPIAFSHQLHLQKGLQCVICHVGVDRGPDARIPSVNFCMTCHQTIATGKPAVQQLKSYRDLGEDVPWQRVYGFEPSAHVHFNHAPHIRAGLDCAGCHGNMNTQTVAVRKINHTMGFCMDCHRGKRASTDCVTCHY